MTSNFDKRYRYPGATPFATEQSDIFFGRSREVNELNKFLQTRQLVVLYSKSGMGKSSLLYAGLIPKLKKEGLQPILPIRFGTFIDKYSSTPAYITREKIAAGSFASTFLDHLIQDEPSMWHDAKEQQILQNHNYHPILIFDQFEEIFTYPEEQIADFKLQLAELLYAQIPQRYRDIMREKSKNGSLPLSEDEVDFLHKPFPIKILVAIRSDRLSLWNKIKDAIPLNLENCYELQPLNLEQAEEAILNPAYNKNPSFFCPPFDYDNDTLDLMLKYLTKNGKHTLESFQLQILCEALEQKIILTKKKKIEREDLINIESIYENYYENQLDRLENKELREKARKLIEEGLILEEEERRLRMYEGQIYRQYGINREGLEMLVQCRLLRSEPSPQEYGYDYELSHDTLVPPILRFKRKRLEEEQQKNVVKKRELAEQRAKDAEEKAKQEEFLRLEAEQARKRARQMVFIVLFLFITSTIFGIYALVEKQKAEIAEADSRKLYNKLKAATEEKVNGIIKEGDVMQKLKLFDDAERLYKLAVQLDSTRAPSINEILAKLNKERQKK